MTASTGKKASDTREIDALLINVFLKALSGAALGLTEADVHKGTLSLVAPKALSGSPLIVIHIDGEVAGSALIQLPVDTALRFVSAMLRGTPIDTIDDMARNSLEELTLRVVEKLRIEFKRLNLFAYINTHTMFDEELKFDSPERFVRIPIATRLGVLTIFVDLFRVNGKT